jgi:hypothetical protein
MDHDPLQRTGGPPATEGHGLFTPGTTPSPQSTSRLAGHAAARASGFRRLQILAFLGRGPATLFEVAAHLGVHDHQISGRFTDLVREGLIAKTGTRKVKPETGCEAEVYRLVTDPPRRQLDAVPGYPDTLNVAGEGLFRREQLLADDLPGIPYSMDQGNSLRLTWRIALVECEGCGKPLRLVESEQGKVKRYRCGTPGCNRTWEFVMVNEPGKAPMVALVMKTL